MKKATAIKALVITMATLSLALAGGVHSQQAVPEMSFFISSAGSGKGADLGGLAGADRHCQSLATAVGAGKRTWHAYLSTTAGGGTSAVNARDRIGKGPWYSAEGRLIARNLDELHNINNIYLSCARGDIIQYKNRQSMKLLIYQHPTHLQIRKYRVKSTSQRYTIVTTS